MDSTRSFTVWLMTVDVGTDVERPSRDVRPAPPSWQPVFAVILVCAGLGLLAGIGIADEDGLNGLVLSLPVIGVVVGGISRPVWTWRSGRQAV
jgi:hypothetical protein